MSGKESAGGRANEPDPGAELEAHGQPVQPGTAKFLAVRKVVHQFQGPLPPPAMLRGYEEVVPAGAERILVMAERQATDRQRIESRGQLFGFSLAASSIAGAFLAVAAGVPLVGVSGIILAVATLSGFFIWGKAGGTKRVPSRRHPDAGSTADDQSGDSTVVAPNGGGSL